MSNMHLKQEIFQGDFNMNANISQRPNNIDYSIHIYVFGTSESNVDVDIKMTGCDESKFRKAQEMSNSFYE